MVQLAQVQSITLNSWWQCVPHLTFDIVEPFKLWA